MTCFSQATDIRLNFGIFYSMLAQPQREMDELGKGPELIKDGTRASNDA